MVMPEPAACPPLLVRVAAVLGQPMAQLLQLPEVLPHVVAVVVELPVRGRRYVPYAHVYAHGLGFRRFVRFRGSALAGYARVVFHVGAHVLPRYDAGPGLPRQRRVPVVAPYQPLHLPQPQLPDPLTALVHIILQPEIPFGKMGVGVVPTLLPVPRPRHADRRSGRYGPFRHGPVPLPDRVLPASHTGLTYPPRYVVVGHAVHLPEARPSPPQPGAEVVHLELREDPSIFGIGELVGGDQVVEDVPVVVDGTIDCMSLFSIGLDPHLEHFVAHRRMSCILRI